MKGYFHVVDIIIFQHSISLTIHKEKLKMHSLYVVIIYVHNSFEKYQLPEAYY